MKKNFLHDSVAAGAPTDQNFWHCGHCLRVVQPTDASLATAENAPLFSQVRLKCPYCHHQTVRLREPSPVKTKTERKIARHKASVERVQQDSETADLWFAKMRAAIHS